MTSQEELREMESETERYYRFEERAAILEFDAGIPRQKAEAMAMDEILKV
jgi:hypothetical protein